MQLQNKVRVVFDTNMVLAIGQLKVDVFSEARKMFGEKADFLVPGQVASELRALAEKELPLKKAVGIAQEQIASNKVKTEEVEAADADEALVELAKSGCFVATNDAVLRKRIKGFGGKVIYLRQGHFLKTG
jgi:rRNA-processing protein FCF1